MDLRTITIAELDVLKKQGYAFCPTMPGQAARLHRFDILKWSRENALVSPDRFHAHDMRSTTTAEFERTRPLIAEFEKKATPREQRARRAGWQSNQGVPWVPAFVAGQVLSYGPTNFFEKRDALKLLLDRSGPLDALGTRLTVADIGNNEAALAGIIAQKRHEDGALGRHMERNRERAAHGGPWIPLRQIPRMELPFSIPARL